MNNKLDALKLLEEHGIKPSFQRVKVLEYLILNETHPTTDEIYKGLIDEVPTLSKATVYNTLNLFLEKKLVSTMSPDNQEIRYDLLMDDHGHFVCESCGTIFNFPYDNRNRYEGLEGFDIKKEEIVLKGTCNQCLNNKNTQED